MAGRLRSCVKRAVWNWTNSGVAQMISHAPDSSASSKVARSAASIEPLARKMRKPQRFESPHQRIVLIVGERAQRIQHDRLLVALERAYRSRVLEAQ